MKPVTQEMNAYIQRSHLILLEGHMEKKLLGVFCQQHKTSTPQGGLRLIC